MQCQLIYNLYNWRTIQMSFKSISSNTLGQGFTYHKPQVPRYTKISVNDAAIDVMTDLKNVAAITISGHESIDNANEKMKIKGIRMLLVVDVHDLILGLITSSDILGEKPMKYIQMNGGTHKDIAVEDIMVPASQINTMHIKDVSHAKVGDIIETLKHDGKQHALVVDNQGPGNTKTVRGIFSISQIARYLGVHIETHEIATTLSEIAHVIHNH